MSLFTLTLSLFLGFQFVHAGLPDKIYGVNLGSWLLIEPWMMPAEWISMGGEICNDCSKCIQSEYAFAEKYPDTVDAKFAKHWDTWFNQADVNDLLENGLNAVRIPLGYWIVEALVDRKTEFYPRGGIKALRRGLTQLKKAGISVVLDHHALPGVHTPNQMFAGRCTPDVQFYTDYNFHRALVWTAVMTALSHLDPAFETVASIQAVNEQIMDASKTPGYGEFSKNFVKTVRAVETLLNIHYKRGHRSFDDRTSSNFTATMEKMSRTSTFSLPVAKALQDAVPILVSLAVELKIQTSIFGLSSLFRKREALVTNFMDIGWQHNNPSTPPMPQSDLKPTIAIFSP
ncbi:hypothetical protein HGRIS_014518 [Hohenbuehelia grisea]|uniref:Glycoside hydrolase family 5 domain-containing protein n=1 Tax=Hohenbuehelia grisea TaxID=104357 RepID=A0ABR3JVN6_9AGAR